MILGAIPDNATPLVWQCEAAGLSEADPEESRPSFGIELEVTQGDSADAASS